MSLSRIVRRALLVTTALLALPTAAHANFAVSAPVAGSSTFANEVKTDWVGACAAGLTCSGLEIAYSRRPDLNAQGRLAEFTDNNDELDPYKTTYVGDPAPLTAISPRLNPALWHVQLFWRQCDADFNCADAQSAVSTFTVAHQLIRPIAEITARYKHIRVLDFQVRFTGNAPSYSTRAVVSVQKQRANGTKFWAPVWNKTELGYGQFGENKEYFSWKAGRTARGAKLRFQATIRANGMKPKVLTLFTTSP